MKVEVEQPVDLLQISSAVHRGCVGLPQELIDHIMNILHDDLRTLKACSLTCKAMFSSTRHLIHRKLYLTRQHNEKVPTRAELCQSPEYNVLRLISHMSECGLLQYTRQVHVRDPGIFIPDTLLPHILYFQSLDRVHTLTIEHYDTLLWAKHYKTCFVHFYPTLTSLTLSRPVGRCRALLRFARQFPNLETLRFEWLRSERDGRLSLHVPTATVGPLPPERDRLRLDFAAAVRPSEDLVHGSRRRIKFRSAEFDTDVYDIHAQHMLDGCAARTLENLTITWHGSGTRRLSFLWLCTARRLANFLPTGTSRLGYLKLTGMTTLHRLTCRAPFKSAIIRPDLLIELFSTINSPFFCEFVLELATIPSQLEPRYLYLWGHWKEIDEFLEGKFSRRGDFKVIIRAGKTYDQEIFQNFVKGGFPLLVRRGCVRFEKSQDREASITSLSS